MLAGCAGMSKPVYKEGSERVRFVTSSPHNCEFIGTISSNYRDSKDGSFVHETEQRAFSEVDLKNKVAAAGGDTVELMGWHGEGHNGEAYKCGRVPASR